MVKCTKCDQSFKNERGLKLHMTLAHSTEGQARLKRQARTRRKNAKQQARHPELLQARNGSPRLRTGNETLANIPGYSTSRGISLLTKSTALWMLAESIDQMSSPQVEGLMLYINQLTHGAVMGQTVTMSAAREIARV